MAQSPEDMAADEAVAALRRLVVAAAREFNAGRYFEAHEVIEDGLEDVPDGLWGLFVGLIQIAVGYHKLTQQLWSGAVRMLALGVEKIEPFGPQAGGINVSVLRDRVRMDIEKLRAGQRDVGDLARSRPRIQPVG
jgi:uncharacterized protein